MRPCRIGWKRLVAGPPFAASQRTSPKQGPWRNSNSGNKQRQIATNAISETSDMRRCQQRHRIEHRDHIRDMVPRPPPCQQNDSFSDAPFLPPSMRKATNSSTRAANRRPANNKSPVPRTANAKIS